MFNFTSALFPQIKDLRENVCNDSRRNLAQAEIVFWRSFRATAANRKGPAIDAQKAACLKRHYFCFVRAFRDVAKGIDD